MTRTVHGMALSLAMAATAVGCGRVHAPAADGGAGSDGGGGGGLQVTVTPARLLVRQGGSQMVQVAVSGQAAGDEVTVELGAPPSGVTAEALTLPAGTSEGTLVVNAASDATQGAFDLMVSASAAEVSGQAPLRTLVAGQPGTPDLSFADAGQFTIMAGGTTVGRGVTALPDGSVVVTGGTATQAVTYQLGPDGTPAAGFGTGGRVLTDGIGSNPDAEGIVVMSPAAGRIVVGGLTGDYSASNTDFALFAYDASGQPDTGFGTTGSETIDFGSGFAEVHAVVADSSGGLIEVGTLFGASTSNHIVRYNSAGAQDTGYAPPAVAAGSEGALIDSSGKLVVVGTQGGDFWVARYLASGQPDTTFGPTGNGQVLVDLSGNDVAYGVNELPGGKLLVVGLFNSNGSDSTLCLARLLPDGTPDDTLAAGGALCTAIAFGTAAPNASVVDSQGRILVAGHDDNSDAPVFAAARLLPDGTPDSTFGTDGLLRVDFGLPTTGSDGAYGIALDPDGRILASGTVGLSPSQSLALTRLWP